MPKSYTFRSLSVIDTLQIVAVMQQFFIRVEDGISMLFDQQILYFELINSILDLKKIHITGIIFRLLRFLFLRTSKFFVCFNNFVRKLLRVLLSGLTN